MAKQDVVLIVILIVLLTGLVQALTPNGATTSVVKSETANASAPQSLPAQAGNVTELNIYGYSTTQSWQGYFGNVSGTIQLTDASGNSMYNWSLANPQGEIYASTNSSINWPTVQCLNFTAKGNYTGTETAGAVNLYGTNLTQLESRFNINSSAVDGVDETFNLIGAGTHDLFYTANLQFSEGECISTRVFSNAGSGESDKFEEVLLFEPTSSSVIFTALLENNLGGFDNSSHDFEMLVLEDGHGTNVATTTYYFYVELE